MSRLRLRLRPLGSLFAFFATILCVTPVTAQIGSTESRQPPERFPSAYRAILFEIEGLDAFRAGSLGGAVGFKFDLSPMAAVRMIADVDWTSRSSDFGATDDKESGWSLGLSSSYLLYLGQGRVRGVRWSTGIPVLRANEFRERRRRGIQHRAGGQYRAGQPLRRRRGVRR